MYHVLMTFSVVGFHLLYNFFFKFELLLGTTAGLVFPDFQLLTMKHLGCLLERKVLHIYLFITIHGYEKKDYKLNNKVTEIIKRAIGGPHRILVFHCVD